MTLEHIIGEVYDLSRVNDLGASDPYGAFQLMRVTEYKTLFGIRYGQRPDFGLYKFPVDAYGGDADKNSSLLSGQPVDITRLPWGLGKHRFAVTVGGGKFTHTTTLTNVSNNSF